MRSAVGSTSCSAGGAALRAGVFGQGPAPRLSRSTRAGPALAAPTRDGLPLAASNPLERAVELLTMLFPVWILVFAFSAFTRPALFTWITPTQFELALGMLTLSMGLSLTKEDFKKVGV